MLEYFVISHTTQDGDIIYYNEQNNLFVDRIDKSTWYENKVEALLTCRQYLRSYINISIKRIGDV